MKVRGYPLPLKLPIDEGDSEPVTIPSLVKAQQASSLKPHLPRNSRVKGVHICRLNVLLQSGLDHKVHV
jgi:hypothetical protein